MGYWFQFEEVKYKSSGIKNLFRKYGRAASKKKEHADSIQYVFYKKTFL